MLTENQIEERFRRYKAIVSRLLDEAELDGELQKKLRRKGTNLDRHVVQLLNDGLSDEEILARMRAGR